MEQEAEGQGSEVKEDVKVQDESGDEPASTDEGGQGDVETVKESGSTEGGNEDEERQGGGDDVADEQTEVAAEQDADGDNEGEGKEGAGRDGSASVESSGSLKQGHTQIEDELRMSKRVDDGDEVVSSKVTTVSFASEVQVLNEDELDEQWTNANDEDENKEESGQEQVSETVGDKVDENNADVESADVPEVGDGNESESIPVGEVPAVVDAVQPVEEPTEGAEPTEQTRGVHEKDSEEAVENNVPPEEAVKPESEHLDPTGTGAEESVIEDANITEHEPVEGQEDAQEDAEETQEIEMIPMAVLQEVKQEVPETIEVFHRAVTSSVPEVTVEAALEATVEDSTDQIMSEEVVETEEEVGIAAVTQPEEAHMDGQVLEAESEIQEEDGSEETVEAIRTEEHSNEEEAVAGERDIAGEHVSGEEDDVDHNENLEDIPVNNEEGVFQNGDMDNRAELQADSALPDDYNLENQGELYTELHDPSEGIAFESGPDMSSTHQEDLPLDGNHLGYEHHGMLSGNGDPLPPIDPEMARMDVHQVPGGQRMEGLSPIELLSQANQVQDVHVLPSQLRSPYHQQHHRNSSKLESESRATSISRIQLARIPSPPAHVKAQMLRDEERRASTRTSSRLPPSVMKMSSVMVNARKKAMKNRGASVYYEEKQFHKIITLDEAINSRPPMPFDLDTPGPCRYSPRNQPLYEDNAPQYSFGTKFPERGGGGRTAYAKTWFNSDNNYTVKTRFERRWPSPNAYGTGKSMVGRRVPDKRDFPVFSMRGKTNFTINKKGSENEPGPDQYHRQKSDPLLFRRAPAFSMGAKLNRGRLFGAPEITPAPNYYNPHPNYTSRKVTYPAYTITGIRKPKSHALGPHATL